MICKAKSARTGKPCKAHAITGGTVCRTHGGSAPQVRDAARLRLALAVDPIVARLVKLAISPRTKPADAAAIARDLLNRAGFVAETTGGSPAGDGGGVLWDEFIAIHRRRVTDSCA